MKGRWQLGPLSTVGLSILMVATAAAAQGTSTASPQEPPTAPGVIRAETNLVLVDVVATDKKGNYIRDLEATDFRVFEDDDEQTITTYSRVADSALQGGAVQPRYMVLFFDNSTMSMEEQVRARQAATQFVEKTASADRLVAIVDFSGAFRVAQNFTDNPELLKRAVGGIKFASLQPNEPGQSTEVASVGRPSMVQVRSDFAARSVLLAMRNLCKTLRAVPGRKTLVLFSAGFPLTAERHIELTATIDAANKANVAVYSVDVRGLQGFRPSTMPDFMDPSRRPAFPGLPPGAEANPHEPSFPHEPVLLASLLSGLRLREPIAQRPGPGGGGGAPTGGGGAPQPRGGTGTAPSPGGTSTSPGGSRAPGGTMTPGTGTSTSPGGTRGPGSAWGRPYGNTGYGADQSRYGTYQPRPIVPPMIDSVTSNQQVLHALATGTGGFTIFNTNDFAEGLSKIAQELDEYYILGYTSSNQAHDGSYHQIEVKVERKGVKLRFRSGYYDPKGPDLLAGKPEGKVLEAAAVSPEPGQIPVSLSTPYFYTSPNVARVNLALEIPANTLDFEKEKGKFHSEVNILGIAYRPDGSVAARFSDKVKLDLKKKELKEFGKGAFSYQNTFNIAPGEYTLKVVLSGGGQKFGKYETPLNVDPYDGGRFHLSGVALSNSVQPVSELAAGIEVALLEERTPLIVRGVEVIPSAGRRFKRDEKVGFYVEVYEPLLTEPNPPRVGIIYDVIDRNTNQQVFTSNTVLLDAFAQEGNPVIPVGLLMPVEDFQAGEYRLQVHARDGLGNVSPKHAVDFALE